MNKLKINSKTITIECKKGDTDTQILAAEIPYIHNNRSRTRFTTTSRNIDIVLDKFRGITEENLHKVPVAIQRIYDKEMQRRSVTSALIDNGPVGETVTENLTLMRHQQLAREISDVNDRYAFFYDTRTGKTPMSLAIIAEDIKKNPHHKWLVLCPLILIENAWLEDAEKFYPDMNVVNLHDTTKARRMKKFKQDANLYISNIESFITYREHIEKLNIHGCFVDESSTMKSHSTKFAKSAVEYAWSLRRWYLLSGTPAPNGEHEYYRQLQSVDFYGIHQSWTRFKQYFFNDVSYNPQYEKLAVKPERKDELLKLLREYSLYVDKEDALVTPGRDFITVDIEMPAELKKIYKELKKELYIELGDNVMITAASTAANLNKLNQVTSGFIMDTHAVKFNAMLKRNPHVKQDKKQQVHLLSDYRFEELDKLLDEIGDKQVLIWGHYRKEFEIVQERLGDKVACVYGATSLTQKNENIRRFKSGDVQYLMANPASADKGLTLTNAHVCIYFSLGYSYELFRQSMERIYGGIQSQPNRCTYYILTAKGTVDAAIYKTVRNKGDMSMAVLEHLKGDF